MNDSLRPPIHFWSPISTQFSEESTFSTPTCQLTHRQMIKASCRVVRTSDPRRSAFKNRISDEINSQLMRNRLVFCGLRASPRIGTETAFVYGCADLTDYQRLGVKHLEALADICGALKLFVKVARIRSDAF
jgi:hypothetical protein